MLKIDENFFEIETAIDDLVEALMETEEAKRYQVALNQYQSDIALQGQIQEFLQKKEEFEGVKEYIAFRPEVKQLRKDLLALKRAIDLNEKVINYRQSQNDFQAILADVATKVAASVSKDAFVDTGLPLAPHRHQHKPGENIRERN